MLFGTGASAMDSVGLVATVDQAGTDYHLRLTYVVGPLIGCCSSSREFSTLV